MSGKTGAKIVPRQFLPRGKQGPLGGKWGLLGTHWSLFRVYRRLCGADQWEATDGVSFQPKLMERSLGPRLRGQTPICAFLQVPLLAAQNRGSHNSQNRGMESPKIRSEKQKKKVESQECRIAKPIQNHYPNRHIRIAS